MDDAKEALTRRYGVALARYVADADEATLNHVRGLGHDAFHAGVGVLDVVSTHQAAYAAVVGHRADLQDASGQRAARLLGACLGPYQQALEAHRETGSTPPAAADAVAVEMSRSDATAKRVQLEAALRQAHALETAGRLANGIAHHFNNLFTVVLGNLERAMRRGADDPDMLGLLAAANRATERGARMVSDLQAFAGQSPLVPARLASSAALRGIVARVADVLPENVVVGTDIADDLWLLDADSARLADALLRLCRNAADALPGGGAIRIVAANRVVRDPSLGLHGAYVVIEVIDGGTGIRPSLLGRVLEPFVTTKDVGAADGLGLSVVHGFAQQSGGAVAIDSALGGGTTVTLYLPAARDVEAVEPPASLAAVRARRAC